MFNLEKVSFGYEKNKELFTDVSLHINKGETLSILGANGVGKTTLLKCTLGFLKPSKGRVLVQGQSLKEMGYKEFWKKVSYVPQAKQISFPYTVLEMVLLGRASYIGLNSKPSKIDIEFAEKALCTVGIEHLKDRYSNMISGGELQLVLIARAIVSSPQIMILDEPESNLDMKNQIIVLKVLEKLKEEEELTTIVNTHFPNHALQIAEKSLLIGDDGSHQAGKTEDIITRENIRQYFGVDSQFLKWDNNKSNRCHKVLYPTDISMCCRKEKIGGGSY